MWYFAPYFSTKIAIAASATTLVAQIAKAQGEGRLEERLAHFAKPKLLIIDELGYLPFEPDGAHLFFQLVSRRYERGAILVTSNRAVSEWGTVFGDAVVTTAILDHLLHHSHASTHTCLSRNTAGGPVPRVAKGPVPDVAGQGSFFNAV